MTYSQIIMCALVRKALWNDDKVDEILQKCTSNNWTEIYNEIKEQRIELLFSDIISTLPNSANQIKQTWKMDCFTAVSVNVQLMSIQEELDKLLSSERLSYIVLKGSAAAVYYPKPLYRTMGDIDIIVQDKDFEKAFLLFESRWAKPSIASTHRGIMREYAFKQGVYTIELHQNYAILTDRRKEKLLDTLIKDKISEKEKAHINNRYSFNMLPSLENGLVLLAHISQHMEGGLGLRQIIDWMMYVDHCLSDDVWPEFQNIAAKLGLSKLAVVTTQLCKNYLGLSKDENHWSESAEEDLVDELMEFVITSGNFGQKQGIHNAVSVIVVQNPNFRTLLKNLQERGETNWRAIKNYPILKPFAWIYQGLRYIRRGLNRKNAIEEFWKDRKAAERRKEMLERLGTTRIH